MKITILGSGTSTGVPEIGCTCRVCTSTDARDKRLRCSGLIDVDGLRILIDCGPDFREQMIRLNDFRPLDAVLISHEHYDHVGGLDDLRPYARYREVPIYTEGYMIQHLKERIPYCFATHLYPGVPHISLNEVTPGRSFRVSNAEGIGIDIVPLRVMHGKLPILGFRIGCMAWITDMTTMDDESYELLKGVDILVMNALRHEPHATHQTVEQALENIQRISPRETYLIHMSHQVGLHAEEERKLPDHVHFAYDGLQLFL